MRISPRRGLAPVAFLLLGLVAVSACAAQGASESDAAPTAASDSHGFEESNAVEVASPALALVIADEEGEVMLLDLETERRSVIAESRADVDSIESDGRLIYVAHGSGERTSVEVIDTARWTAPHGDHTHSFLGEPRFLGTLEGEGDVSIAAATQRATVHFASGDLVLVAHDELDDGIDDAPHTTIEAAGPVVPFADHLLTPTADATVEARDADGAPAPELALPCSTPTDADITRVGAVFGCAEGAVLFTREVGGTISAESIAYPAGAPAATELSGRPDRPDLAGVAGDQGAWLLDVRERQWRLLPSDVPLLRVVAIGDDDSRTVAVDAEGRVRVLAADGTLSAVAEPLLAASVADPSLRDRVLLIADADHAYITDPALGAVHEIDLDDASVTRTFADLDPWLLRQVG